MRARLGLVVLLAVAVGGGCGGPSVSSSREEATVRGKVTIQGKAAASGQVVFDPANVRRRDVPVVSGPIGADGTYSIKTLVGGNTVHVRAPEVSKDPKLLETLIPFEVKEGENTLDIALPVPATP